MGRNGWNLSFIGLFVVAIIILCGAQPATAQTDPTSTPDAEGIIYDMVRSDDTMWAVSYRNGITLEELLAFNNLTESDFIHPGDLLIVGIVTPAAPPTPAELPTVTPTRPPPTATHTAVPPPPTKICFVAFIDDNSNAVFDVGESLQKAVAITVFDSASVLANYITDGVSEPHCTDELAPGEYQITRSVLPGETLTTSGNRTIILQTGDVVNLQFGGTMGEVIPTQPPTMSETAVVVPINSTAVTVGTGSASGTEQNTPVQSEPPSNSASLFGLGIVLIGSLILGGIVIFILRLRTP